MDSSSDSHPMEAEKLAAALSVPTKSDAELFQLIVDTPFRFKLEAAFLFLGITVLLLANKKTGMIDRVALSNTELAVNTTKVSSVPFKEIKIPLSHLDNIIAKAIESGRPQETTDWENLFAPALTPEQARINQASAGVAYSAVYPLKARDGGAMIFSFYQYSNKIGAPQHDFIKAYAELVSARLQKG